MKSGDLASCDQFKGQVVNGADYGAVCRNNVYWNEAQKNLDFKACEGLDGTLMSVADCENAVMSGLISKEKTLSVCDTVPDALKAGCPRAYWSFTALDQRNVKLCRNLASTTEAGCERSYLVLSLRMSGAATASTSLPLVCSEFSDSGLQSDCASLQAKKCAEVSDPMLKSACMQNHL